MYKDLNIFVIEDNEMHKKLLCGIIKSINLCSISADRKKGEHCLYLHHKVHCLEKMEDWKLFLKRRGEYSSLPRPDLLILDMMLGGNDGWDVLEYMRKSFFLKKIPTLITSAINLEGCNLKSKYSNVVDILCKPDISNGIKENMIKMAGSDG